MNWVKIAQLILLTSIYGFELPGKSYLVAKKGSQNVGRGAFIQSKPTQVFVLGLGTTPFTHGFVLPSAVYFTGKAEGKTFDDVHNILGHSKKLTFDNSMNKNYCIPSEDPKDPGECYKENSRSLFIPNEFDLLQDLQAKTITSYQQFTIPSIIDTHVYTNQIVDFNLTAALAKDPKYPKGCSNGPIKFDFLTVIKSKAWYRPVYLQIDTTVVDSNPLQHKKFKFPLVLPSGRCDGVFGMSGMGKVHHYRYDV